MEEQKLLLRLQKSIDHAKSSPFYKKHLMNTNIHSLEDFKRIPFLTKRHLRENSPFGLLAVSKNQTVQYHESSGTTGQPISIWYSESDLNRIINRTSETGVHFSNKDTMVVRFPYAMSIIAHTMQDTGKKHGTCIIPTDSRTTITPMTRVIELLRKCEATILACMSLHAVMLAEVAEGVGLNPRKDFPHLRAICTAGEPITLYRRRLLERIWGVPVYDNYGMTETGTIMVDCKHQHLHQVNDDFYLEILEDDLQTATQQGDIGNLVITSLSQSATPMIRYITGDTVRISTELCTCGKPYYEIHGRKEAKWTVKDIEFDLWDIEEIISPLNSNKYWAAATRNDALHLVIEKEGQESEANMISKYEQELKEKFGVSIYIHYVEKGALYDRREPLSFGMKGKPIYVLPAHELDYVLNRLDVNE
ncbi:phenylacetate--CoA ligase family protein [Bacillus weihaiensis]|uniref:phenylacetate--CoA ligase family protein n=1 Tax=Bacillus weihaiensis TaxID=1547283 RepID=UPI0023559E94|nr:AMP-binding protein [Bacillus weihaiensis]